MKYILMNIHVPVTEKVTPEEAERAVAKALKDTFIDCVHPDGTPAVIADEVFYTPSGVVQK